MYQIFFRWKGHQMRKKKKNPYFVYHKSRFKLSPVWQWLCCLLWSTSCGSCWEWDVRELKHWGQIWLSLQGPQTGSVVSGSHLKLFKERGKNMVKLSENYCSPLYHELVNTAMGSIFTVNERLNGYLKYSEWLQDNNFVKSYLPQYEKSNHALIKKHNAHRLHD